MKIQIDWGEPLSLKLVSRQGAGYQVDLNALPADPGIYIMGRMWAKGFEALYVGKARNIRRRVKGQLNNLRLMQHLRGSKTGKRVVVAGSIDTRQGQQIDRVLAIAERALIRHFLSDGDNLVNISGTTLRQHEVESTQRPRWFVPRVVFLEKGGRL